ncbi:MAG TPA: AAA family ATPase, partial [Candidatus Dormibacteraeota bacterium]
DVVHFSGHGLAGGLVLETEEGSRDLVEAGDLIELLHPARDQLELVTLFSCLSAASTAASTLRRLGLPPVPADAAPERAPAGRPLTALATRIACRLGCAVLAMRHPIEDGFAIDLSLGLYHRLLDNRQPLPRALQLAIQNAVRAPAGLRPSALAPATPAIFGAPAAELRFQAPAGTPLFFDPRQLRAAGLPREPERFVGRVGQLARASRALAAGSGQSGVLFHGPPGHGRTTCAAELAYRHQDGFGLLAWHDLPGPGADIQDALAGLARTLDARVEGLRLAERVDSRERLEAFLPLLAEFLERRAVLLVLDNLESLLTEAGGWRDARWEPLVAALTGHRGQSRVVLVSRRPPAVLDPGVQVEEIGPLTRVEQALLARELPRLGALIRADEPGPGLARRLLETSGGAPGRLVRADAALADPAAAEALLREAGAAGERPSRPLREVDVLRGRYNALVEKARDLGLTEDRELSALATRVTSLLYDGPIDVAAAAAAVASYQERLAGHDQWADRD